MYVCMSVTFYDQYTIFSASAVVVRWRTQRAEDDDWLGNEPRGIEDDKLFNSEMTDDRTTQTEDNLHASSRATHFAC